MLNDKLFLSTVFFWVFVVCGLVALAMFHGKVPDDVNASNVWGFVVGMIGVISTIISRVLATSAIRDSVSGKDESVE